MTSPIARRVKCRAPESAASVCRAQARAGVSRQQLLWNENLNTLEEPRLALLEFKGCYNNGWLVQKHGHTKPSSAQATARSGSMNTQPCLSR